MVGKNEAVDMFDIKRLKRALGVNVNGWDYESRYEKHLKTG